MNSAAAVAALLAALVAAVAISCRAQDATDKQEIEKYLSAIEKTDVDSVINESNVKCFLNEGPCTSQFEITKKVLPVLVKDGCAECTRQHKNIIRNTIDKIKSFSPDNYEKLFKILDPEGKYEKTFMESLNA